MSFRKANVAGLASARQQSEMKSILAGTWPPLKPLPVFKYEDVAYRATIDFDKLRGEWVCRKISFPSNQMQELRGALREITMALPHGEIEMCDEDPEPSEQELEKDTYRRLQAIRNWRENTESGARYFELREYLSESQRTEVDDSLRLSLTARQLQFNAKNVASVFDALSTAGGRFATLVDFAKRNQAKLTTAPSAESVLDHGNFSPEVSIHESTFVAGDDVSFVRDQPPAEPCIEELPTLSIKNVLLEKDSSFLADRMEHTTSQELGIAAADIANDDSAFLVVQRSAEEQPAALSGVPTEPRMDRYQDSTRSSVISPALEISAFQVVAFALLLFFSVAAFAVGLTAGRGPLGRHLFGASKTPIAMDPISPARHPQSVDSTWLNPTPPLTRPNESRSTGEVAKTIESPLPANPDVTSARAAATGPIAGAALPPAISTEVPSPKAVVPMSSPPKNPAPDRSTGTLRVTTHLSKPSTILVNVPIRGSQPFRVSFPEKAIAATSSFALTSQLSVLLLPEPRAIEADKPIRLEAGQLVSFVWPSFQKQRDLYGGAEVIRVRATIGPLGQVREVAFLGGSRSLLPATTRAIRQWRYTPTLFDKRPIQAQEDLTIEFRQPQRSVQAPRSHPHHN